jgi:hypothetical protein
MSRLLQTQKNYLLHSQEPANGPYLEPGESGVHPILLL